MFEAFYPPLDDEFEFAALWVIYDTAPWSCTQCLWMVPGTVVEFD